MSRAQDGKLEVAAAAIRKELDAAECFDVAAMEHDIKARQHEAEAGRQWANVKDDLAKRHLNLGVWCRRNLKCEPQAMDRRLRLWKKWPTYEKARRKAGNSGLSGLGYALQLIRDAEREMKGRGSPSHYELSADGLLDLSRVQFLCGDALEELKKLNSGSMQCCITSPPYFGGLRNYGHAQQIGHEKTLGEHISKLVAVFREVRRVLADDGLLWIVVGDVFGQPGGRWHIDAKGRVGPRRGKRAIGLGENTRQATGRKKDLQGVPFALASALKAEGWLWRGTIIWVKSVVRPESVKDRPTKSHDYILLFAQQERYIHNFPALAEPRGWPEDNRKPGNRPRAGVVRNETEADYRRAWGEPDVRHVRDVWHIPPSPYRGSHPATFPPELPRRCIVASCPPGQSYTVLDPFSGAGTTLMVAGQLGHAAIGIELNPRYIKEAQARLKAAPAHFPLPHEAGNQPHHFRLRNTAYAKAALILQRDELVELCEQMGAAEKASRIIRAHPETVKAAPMISSAPPKSVDIGNATLFQGDWADVASGLHAGCADLVFADLPYGVSRLRWDVPVDQALWWKHALRLTKPNSVILMCGNAWQMARCIASQEELHRFCWHWLDDGPSDNQLHTGQHPLIVGEFVVVFSPSGEEFVFNPQKLPLERPRTQWLPELRSSLHCRRRSYRRVGPVQYEFSHPTNILFFPREKGVQLVATQKPIAMASYFIRTYSNAGHTVLDLTMGRGTFGHAALLEGRKFIGCERDPANFAYAEQRIRNAVGQGKPDRLAAD